MSYPKIMLFLSPRQAKWLYYLLAIIPLDIARTLRRDLAGLLESMQNEPEG
jgi:hypothetical protein